MTDCAKGMMCFQSYVSSSKKKRQGQRNASSIHIATTLPTLPTLLMIAHMHANNSYKSPHRRNTYPIHVSVMLLFAQREKRNTSFSESSHSKQQSQVRPTIRKDRVRIGSNRIRSDRAVGKERTQPNRAI